MTQDPPHPVRLELLAVPGLPEITPGDDLAAALLAALAASGLVLADGDVLAVASKVVAKAEGRFLRDATGAPLPAEAAVAAQTERVVAQRRTPHGLARIVLSRSGPVLAAAGVDASNLPPGSPPLALPADPDGSARALRTALVAACGIRVAVVVTDTLGRPWRIGQIDTAIGAAGLIVAEDLTGVPDTHGRRMEVTVRALADEIASAADLVRGKVSGVPVALVRGLAHLVTDQDGPGAAALLRPAANDWFAYGHAEAARAAIGLEPDDENVAPQPVSGTPRERLERAVVVAAAAGVDTGPTMHLADASAVAVSVRPAGSTPQHWARAGALAQRVVVAAWAEGLRLQLVVDADGGCHLTG